MLYFPENFKTLTYVTTALSINPGHINPSDYYSFTCLSEGGALDVTLFFSEMFPRLSPLMQRPCRQPIATPSLRIVIMHTVG